MSTQLNASPQRKIMDREIANAGRANDRDKLECL